MMKATIKYELGGREVDRDEFLSAMRNNFDRMVAEKLIGTVIVRLSDVCCTIHGVTPTVVFVEDSGTNASFVLRDLCCDDLKASAEDAFKPLRGPSAV